MIGAHTTLFNYTGQPALVLPCTRDADGLPIGAQLVTKRWSEARLLAIARSIARVTEGYQHPPSVNTRSAAAWVAPRCST
jgi:amidase